MKASYSQGLWRNIIFESLPGAGAVMAPWLLAAFGSQRDRYSCADELQQWDCTGNRAQRETEMGAFPLGVSQVFAAKFSRMGRSLDCAIGLGPGVYTSNNVIKARTTTPPCGP